jgi:hypothetical protein
MVDRVDRGQKTWVNAWPRPVNQVDRCREAKIFPTQNLWFASIFRVKGIGLLPLEAIRLIVLIYKASNKPAPAATIIFAMGAGVFAGDAAPLLVTDGPPFLAPPLTTAIEVTALATTVLSGTLLVPVVIS